ncbi:MAG: hypothetical protein A3F67_00025 [Verrucomicrobia bacterium RIFCSPHIGHO2_12_FULL_41_10]|nr:MAG: hypothetical protein A3F67_00025 [Verrucomicrobia bacterium RIFCSPHIGHO2_12_FULL_41_10]HLB34296.1 hypothetical protein [Chthoniobacterales bacterium]
MPNLSIIFGLLLNIVGLVGFFGTGSIHYTALIPCILGVLLILSGIVAKCEHLHKHAMHVAVLVSLLGFLGTASSLRKISLFLDSSAILNAPATAAKIITAVLCGLFFILCIRSFVKARLSRKAPR